MPSTVGILSGAGSLKNPAEAIALGYRINYIKNPSFEVDTSDWTSVAGATLSRTTSEFNTGSACLRVVNSSASGVQTATRIPFLGGQGTYYLSAYIKLDVGATTANYSIRHLQYESLTASTTVSSGNVGTTSLSSNGSWVRISGAITRSVTAEYFILRIFTSSTTPGDVFFVDSVMAEKSNTLRSYFDGSSNGFWTGAENASFSGATPY